ncbi:MAG: HAD-IG family 5'-nucleotidase [Myxococcales bacterium]|nr:MAG: HAD-IG family 5'-nucleotidase [Myxococcales bacterium]
MPQTEQLVFNFPGMSYGAPLAPPRSHRIYCNRNLRFDLIQMIGFDMDYTLAIYNQAEMDRLSIEVTIKKLVEQGYPELLLKMPFRTDFPIRGLHIDKKYGHVLKMDRYQYVKKAYHGLHRLSLEERRSLYHRNRLRVGSSRYHWVDTLYALSEVSVFSAAVEALDKIYDTVDYEKLFTDIRTCIDLAHQDGSILDEVSADLPRFVYRDDLLARTLHKLRSSGKRLFLLTNSQADYTQKMMTYLLEGQIPEYASWKSYFDMIICAARKPLFFEGGTPLLEVLPNGERRETQELERGKIYMGGNVALFEQLSGVGGDDVLYVGDHIYGDVLRTKKESAWRTAMILQEMTEELGALERCEADISHMDHLDLLRDALYDELREHQTQFRHTLGQLDQVELDPAEKTALEARRTLLKRRVETLRTRFRALDQEFNTLEEEVDRAFHPFWGSLLKSGPEVSSFGDQVEKYACLYTDRVSSFWYYSPMHYFRSPRDRMPHER